MHTAFHQVLWSAAQWKGDDVVEYGHPVAGFPGRVTRYPMLAKLQAPQTAVLVDGTVLEGVDAVVYCTGYQYSMPFLDDPQVVSTDGQRCVDCCGDDLSGGVPGVCQWLWLLLCWGCSE